MAQRVQEVAANDNVILHADMTGGMRYVNMLMLELTRRLQYSGLTVGNVLHSKRNRQTNVVTVEALQNICDWFQLIAGVEEFVNFGSVRAPEKYYEGRKRSEPLTKLCSAMKDFFEAIKLCHYGQFSATSIELHAPLSLVL